ncbi:lysozyme inhibitor LprI family protein [Marivita sp. S0852]|uniref:lysozyme inhibitor LprI family protein n=1 Tax=Marivita sp. S0852 TaxID=3373893 RepID=UPI003981D0CA
MKRGVAAVIFACSPAAGWAQDLKIDPAIVRTCFEATEVGALFPSCLGQASAQCQDGPEGSTTAGMAECIVAETAEWDAILNEEYKATQAVNAANDREGRSSILDRTDALRDAQRAWIAFRDADCAARYAIWQDGTIRTIVGANCHLTMTASRAVQLRDMRGF